MFYQLSTFWKKKNDTDLFTTKPWSVVILWCICLYPTDWPLPESSAWGSKLQEISLILYKYPPGYEYKPLNPGTLPATSSHWMTLQLHHTCRFTSSNTTYHRDGTTEIPRQLNKYCVLFEGLTYSSMYKGRKKIIKPTSTASTTESKSKACVLRRRKPNW